MERLGSGRGHRSGHVMAAATATPLATATSSATSPTPSSAPSSPSSPPRTAPARRPSPEDGAPSGAPRLSTSTPPTTFTATSSSASPSSLGFCQTTPARPAASLSASSASTRPKKGLPRKINSWFHSPSLHNLQELDIGFDLLESGGYEQTEKEKRCSLPPSVLCLASTLLVVSISSCDFPKEIAPSLNFPLLKNLKLWRVSISEDVFSTVLSACHVLDNLYLSEIREVSCLRISSRTLRIIVICSLFQGKGELLIKEAPCLERLLLSCPGLGGEIIRVVRAPKLEILGLLSPCISEIEFANIVFQGLIPSSSENPICSVKVLALHFSSPDLGAVLDILRCFPCLEKLYVIWGDCMKAEVKNVRQYEPLDPIKCLESHLKVLVLTNYKGGEEDVGFAKFFVLNAEVAKEINFVVCKKIDMDKKWMTDQLRLLEVENRASQDARLKFGSSSRSYYYSLDTRDLSIADPFSNYCFVDGVDALSEAYP